jgi:type I restriction enzyme S subunit
MLRRVSVLIPPKEEQKAISSKIFLLNMSLNRLIAVASNQMKFLQERRAALISAAVTGKIDVRHWQPPPSNSTTSQDTP